MKNTLLTSDKLPFMVLFFGFTAGILLIGSTLFIGQLVTTFKSLSRGAPETAIRCEGLYPSVCTEYNVKEESLRRAGIGILLLLIAVFLWSVGMRYRTVSIKENNVIIGWGEFLPIPYASIPANELTNFTITKELRFTVTPGPGSSQRVNRVNDRWRLTAMRGNKKINLGSYVSEQAAKDAVTLIQQ